MLALLLLLMAEEFPFYYHKILLVNSFSSRSFYGINKCSEVVHAEGLGLFIDPSLELHVIGGYFCEMGLGHDCDFAGVFNFG